MHSTLIFPGLLAGIFDFNKKLNSILRFISTVRTEMRISITVQYQDNCSVEGQRLNSSAGDNNNVYINMVDNFYVTVHARRRGYGT